MEKRNVIIAAMVFLLLLLTFSSYAANVGDKGKAVWHGKEYSAEVTKKKGDRCFIHWIGESGNYDEWQSCSAFKVTEPVAAKNDFNVGDHVVCRWKNGSTWYPGVIVEKTGRQVFIHYNDGDKEHTTIDKCLKRDGAAPIDYAVGEAVKIKWKESWYNGSIIDVNKKKKSYKIHYDGYSNSWDEWVKTDRLQKK